MNTHRNILILCLLVLCESLFAQVRADRLNIFTTDSSLRVELVASSDRAYSSRLTASITSCVDGSLLWKGELGKLSLNRSAEGQVCSYEVDGLSPELWSPSSPVLYQIEISGRGFSCGKRIGFRRFEMKGGNFYLNGKPLFLRGNAINPPGRGIPEALETSKEFAREYVRFLKSQNINIIRIPTNQNWLDVCDEEGMMVFGGRYGRPRICENESKPSTDIAASVEYYIRDEFTPLSFHPSVVIYVMSNEMPYDGVKGERWHDFLQSCYGQLVKWDSTRAYIGNAGYGMGREADVYDVHRYWGWYYNSFLTFLNLRDAEAWQNPSGEQAITFTECVGNYTGIDGAYNLCSRTKQPGSQKCWTGHAPAADQSRDALEYQAFVLKNVTEMFRRFRPSNHRISGVMPFTIMFHNWDGISSFSEMKPKPAAYQYGVSYQPVLLSWENWNYNAYAGNSVSTVLHIVNDDDLFRDLSGAEVKWRLLSADGKAVCSGGLSLPDIPYYGTYSTKLSVQLPRDLATGNYTLEGQILDGGVAVSSNTTRIFVADSRWKSDCAEEIASFSKRTATLSSSTGISSFDTGTPLIVAEDSWSKDFSGDDLRDFVKRGGKVLVMKQEGEFDTSWLPTRVEMLGDSNNSPQYLSPSYAYCDGMNINLERADHKVFKGLDRYNFRLWSDYTGFDESQAGFPRIYPVSRGFSLRKADIGKVAVLANYSRNLSGTALCELFEGEGSVLLSGFDLSSRLGLDPIADRFYANILSYLCSDETDEAYREISDEIIWGDYASERGVATGANNGLLLNTFPIVPADQQKRWPLKVDNRGYQYVGSYGGWNSRPGIQYVPKGRRPFAPYDYTPGGSDTLAPEDDGRGEGHVAIKLPADRRYMYTTLWNPYSENASLTISINGEGVSEVNIPSGETITVESSLPHPVGDANRLKLSFAGSRYCVILKSEFSAVRKVQSAPYRTNVFRGAEVYSSGSRKGFPGSLAVDGRYTRDSRWISSEDYPHLLEVSLKNYCEVDSVVIVTGIPEAEKEPHERHQREGYWNVKNFIIQYWDDANWTDLDETYTTENRLDTVSFRLSRPVTSCRFRLKSTDGEAVRIIEFEGWGRELESMPAPSVKRGPELGEASRSIAVKVLPRTEGKTMKYVGYNQGYYVPGSNVSSWIEYSGVNSVRLWTESDTYLKNDWIDMESSPAGEEEFSRLKAALSSNPEGSGFINWGAIASQADKVVYSTNSMSLNYALDELHAMGVDVLLQCGFGKSRYNTSWTNKWQLWQKYYALAFYAARRADVEMYAMKNEPNHKNAGPMSLSLYIELMKVCSDAVHTAIKDVNRIYGKSLEAKFIGPVTAGTNTDWWAAVAATPGYVDLFSTHSYNIPASGYIGRTSMISSILRDNSPQGRALPIIYTEIGRWMNAYLIDKDETMDSPSLFSEWAGIYTRNMLEGAYGMWAFKFANTASSTYPRGIKSGHHYIWKGTRFAEDALDNIALGCSVSASASDSGHPSFNVVDGDKSDSSSWICSADGVKTLTLSLGEERRIGGLSIYTGSEGGVFTAPDRARNFSLEAFRSGSWEKVPAVEAADNKYAHVWYLFDEPLSASQLRLTFSDEGKCIVREVKVYGEVDPSLIERNCYDVAGTQRTAQVVRLFAKGFKDERPLLALEQDTWNPAVDVCASVDSLAGKAYLWLVNRGGGDVSLSIDLSSLGCEGRSQLIREEVSAVAYGDAELLRTDRHSVLHLDLRPQSVSLVTVPLGRVAVKKTRADHVSVIEAPDAYSSGKASAAIVHFKKFDSEAAGCLLGFSARTDGGQEARYHVYVRPGGKYSGGEIEGLDVRHHRVTGTSWKVAGEVLLGADIEAKWLDVSAQLQGMPASPEGVNFLIIRELRDPSDGLETAARLDGAPQLYQLR